MAYKSIDAVMEAQRDLVGIMHTLRQVVCVKDESSGAPNKKARAQPLWLFFLVQFRSVLGSCVSGGGRVVRPSSKPRKAREEGSKLKRQLVANGCDGDWRGFDHLNFVTPRVELDASAKRQRSNLVKLSIVEFRCGWHQGRETGDLSLFARKTVTQMRRQQGRERCRAR